MIKTESDDGLYVHLTVQDAGIGFAPDVVDRLFESFFTTKDDGMGVGLSQRSNGYQSTLDVTKPSADYGF